MLLAVAALLYSTRYLAAAIFGSGISSWDADLFRAMLEYVGKGPVTWSLAALVAGIVYLVWAEVETLWSHGKGSDADQARNPR
jgi:hypothetical protein